MKLMMQMNMTKVRPRHAAAVKFTIGSSNDVQQVLCRCLKLQTDMNCLDPGPWNSASGIHPHLLQSACPVGTTERALLCRLSC